MSVVCRRVIIDGAARISTAAPIYFGEIVISCLQLLARTARGGGKPGLRGGKGHDLGSPKDIELHSGLP